ncbi:Endocytosis and vacuole integrity protein [Massospora cicadina]|nr:Endocytosis and vacuole integrity protein [Massospora cicadina]
MNALPSQLQADLTSLSNVARRKHPEIKEACEKMLRIILAAKDRPPKEFAIELANTEETLKPIQLACNTKTPKLVIIAIGCLHRLILHRGVREAAVPQILRILSEVLAGNVEVQLKVLQTVLPLLTNYECIRGELLNSALLICFKLQESRVAVVNNTAAATLRQLVIIIFDNKIHMDPADHLGLDLVTPDGMELDVQTLVSNLSPDAKDAYFLFQDLCYMTAGETPILLKPSTLNRAFSLELVESVLTNQPQAFQRYPEFTALLKEKLCSVLIRSFSERGDFPHAARIMRVVLLLIRLFFDELAMEVEIFITMLLKILDSEETTWHRFLAAEVIRGICGSRQLRSIYQGYDKVARGVTEGAGTSALFRDIIRVLGKLAHENPLQFRSLSRKPSEPGSGVGFQSNEAPAFSVDGAALRVQCIDQLDRSEAPTIPEGYLLYLVLRSVDDIVGGLCGEALPNLLLPPIEAEHAGDSELRSGLTLQLGENAAVISEMVELSWAGILTILSFLVKQPMDEELTRMVVNGLERFTLLCGALGFVAPRDAFMGCIHKNAFPYAASYEDPDAYPTSAPAGGTFAGNNPTTSALTERHGVYLNSLLAIAQRQGDLLGDAWLIVLDALQHIQRLLLPANGPSRSPSTPSLKSASLFGKDPLTDAAAESLRRRIRQFFDEVRFLNDDAFSAFLRCLVRLAVESAGATFCDPQAEGSPGVDRGRGAALNLAPFKQEESLFAIEQLRTTCLNTMPRLINQASTQWWGLILDNLIRVANGAATTPGVRAQACESISDLLLTGISCASSMRLDSQQRVQLQMLQPLARWMGQDEERTYPTVQKAALETLDKLLQSSGHSFVHGWDLIFAMLLRACPAQLSASPVANELATDATPESKARPAVKLVRIAFPCLQLICTDFLAPLPLACLRACILTVGRFGLQDQDLNTSLTAVGMLWNVLDYLQRRLDDEGAADPNPDFRAPFADDAPNSVVLRQLLLLTFEQLAFVCADPRPEVRNGANQTLFRTLSSNGGGLPKSVWSPLVWEILFPLLDEANTIYCNLDGHPAPQPQGSPDMMLHHSRNTAKKQWDETRVLMLGGISSVFRDFMLELSPMPDFDQAWRLVLTYISEAALVDSPEVSLAALRSLSRLLSHHLVVRKLAPDLKARLWKAAWASWRDLGTRLSQGQPELPITRLTEPLPSQMEGEVITALATPLKAGKLQPVDQSILTCFVEGFGPIFDQLTLGGFCDADWQDLLGILLATLRYSNSPDYPNDCESLSPLQNAAVKLLVPLLKAADHPTLPSVLMRSLPDFCLLAFQGTPQAKSRRAPCYISLCCALLSELESLFQTHAARPDLYADPGLLSRLFRMLDVCIRSKYEDPRHLPVWKLAIEVANRCSGVGLAALEGLTLPEPVLATFIESYLTTLGVLFDTRPPPVDVAVSQLEADERFEVEALALAFCAVVPALRHPTVPDALVARFVATLESVSAIESEPAPRPPTAGPDTVPFTFLVKEQLAFAALRCLVCLCMGASERRRVVLTDRDLEADNADPVRQGYRAIFEVDVPPRVAQAASPVLMTRCLSVLAAFARDIPLFGKRPLPRVRRDEILFLLRHLDELSLPPASCHHLLLPTPNAPLRAKVTEELLRGSSAHLFLVYPILCQILWCRDPAIVGCVANCLKRIGVELGLAPPGSPTLANGLLPHQ